MRAAGAKVVRPDIAAFRQAIASAYTKAKASYGARVDAILKDAKAG